MSWTQSPKIFSSDTPCCRASAEVPSSPPATAMMTSGVEIRKTVSLDFEAIRPFYRRAAGPRYATGMRVMGVDLGTKRIGLAVSDASGTLARPWKAVPAASSPLQSAEAVLVALRAFVVETGEAASEDGPGAVFAALVVGFPQRLGGGDTHLTATVRAFATALAERTGLTVHLQDERLSSHEAETRLTARERDWRKRKALLDAEAAAVILQDYLDASATRAPVAPA